MADEDTKADDVTDAGAAEAAAADTATNAGKADEGKATEPTWRDDWREQLAGTDEKDMARLKRFNSPGDVWKSLKAADQRINSGEFVQRLPEKATDEQIAAYREKMGIPEAPEGYLDKLSGGLNIGDDDKPIIDAFLKTVHGKNWTPGQVDDALQWYYSEMDQRQAALVEHDKGYRSESEDALRADWGNEYRANINLMTSWLDTAPEGVKDTILNGRGADGNLLGDNPKVLAWLVGLAKEANPAGIVAPGEGSTAKGVEDRLAEIRKYRMTNREAYFKDEKVLAEERRLLEAQDRMKGRAA